MKPNYLPSFKNGKIIKKSKISPGSKWAESINAVSIPSPISSINLAVIFPLYNVHLSNKFGNKYLTQEPISSLEIKSTEYKCEFSMSFIAFNIIIELPPLATPIYKIFFGLYFRINPFKNSYWLSHI